MGFGESRLTDKDLGLFKKQDNILIILVYQMELPGVDLKYIRQQRSIKSSDKNSAVKAMSGFISNSDKDSLMRASYYQITRNFTKTVNRFVAFKDEDKLIEIPHGIGQRSKFIDLMIKYFETLEEYEKCNKLLKLKDLVIMAGD